MSAYMFFYVRKGDTFTCINCLCKSSAIYGVFSPYMSYEDVVHIDSIIDRVKADCREIVDGLNRKRKEYKRKIAAITQTNSPIAEKMECIDMYYELLNDVKQKLDEHKSVFYFCNFLEDILDCNEGDEKPILYAGIETGYNITWEDIEGE